MQRAKANTETRPKRQDRAGATPPCAAFSRPKLRGVTPALSRILREPFWPCRGSGTEVLVVRLVLPAALQKKEKHLPLLKALSKQPKTTTIQVRVDEEVRRNLDRYAEFIGAHASYVVSEALKLLFKRDAEFKCWLGEHPTNINQEQVGGDVLTKTA